MKNLTFEERQAIESFLVDGKSHRAIANFLKRDRRSIDREVLSQMMRESSSLCRIISLNLPRMSFLVGLSLRNIQLTYLMRLFIKLFIIMLRY